MQIQHVDTLQPHLGAITIMGSGRLGPTLAALIGLAGTAIGGLALARASRSGPSDADAGATRRRRSPDTALVLGALSVVFGGLFLATADGGPGTGNGVVGSFAALVLGPIALVLGALARSREQEVRPTARDEMASGTA